VIEELLLEWEDATRRAYDALARYKFWMFGYHAARVVYVGSLIHRHGGPRLVNPFAGLVATAREMYCRDCGEMRRGDHRCTSESLTWADPAQLALLEPPR
jgi:hypothetical protein